MRYELPDNQFPELEKHVLAFWGADKIFERSLKAREGAPTFVTTDGPPFATGLPHYGHLLAGTIKDTVLRYKSMKGVLVPRRFGWDCHGLPIENEVEKSLELSGGASIEAYGIDKFNEACRSIVMRYAKEWQHTVHRMGRWVDFTHCWHTMDLSYMETVWALFKQLYDKGLVYQGFRVMPVSAKLGTPLSNFEAGENYKTVDDPSITLTLPLVDEPDTALLVWTTTPWTLPSNLAAMVGPDISYVKVHDRTRDKFFIVAEARLETHFPNSEEIEVRARFPGQQLLGTRYVPPFEYFTGHPNAFIVIGSDEVSTDDGTGIVHSAPAFGELDFAACKEAGIELVCPVTINGLFTDAVPDFQGQFVKDADRELIRRLKRSGRLFSETQIHHRYPFCWRSDTPLIYRAVETWFVRVEAIKDKLLAANAQIHWTPGHIKEGRFGKWLASARDWNVARNRFWGNPLPVWQSADGDRIVVGSIQELESLTGTQVTDLHRHHIDSLAIERDGKTYRRIPEVFDCWFESGAAPYASRHYPFETPAPGVPLDFIAEGLDQTRGWFYTLTVLAAALFDQPAFSNVIVNGIILAKDGNKMSKRLRNYPDPQQVMEKYGADAIRLYMLHSPAARADDLRFSEHGVELVMRQLLIPLWNALSFLTTYARIEQWQPTTDTPKATATVDRWLLSMVHKLIHNVELGMDGYDLTQAVEPFVGFIEQLTNWYIRLNRRRFWEAGAHADDLDAFALLHHALLTLVKITAPFIPFLSETIYQQLKSDGMPDSVHLCDYPAYDPKMRDHELEQAMEAVQKVVSLGHALRKQHRIKVRQPLGAVHIATQNEQLMGFLEEQKHLIASELNVKQVLLSGDETQFVQLSAKPNFRILGKKVGPLMPAVQNMIRRFDQTHLETLRLGQSVTIDVEGTSITLTQEDVTVERQVRQGLDAINEGSLTLALDTTVTDALLAEGLVREVINKVSTMRREAQLDYTDRIKLTVQTTPRVQEAIADYMTYLKNEVLAVSIAFESCQGQLWDVNGEPTTIALSKAV